MIFNDLIKYNSVGKLIEDQIYVPLVDPVAFGFYERAKNRGIKSVKKSEIEEALAKVYFPLARKYLIE